MTAVKPVLHNKVRKGDVVALTYLGYITYALGSGRGTENVQRTTLAIVDSASRAGEATSLRRNGNCHILHLKRGDYTLADVKTISKEHQAKALAVFKTLRVGADDGFKDLAAVRAAILAEEEKA